jgi:hypothetical protein
MSRDATEDRPIGEKNPFSRTTTRAADVPNPHLTAKSTPNRSHSGDRGSGCRRSISITNGTSPGYKYIKPPEEVATDVSRPASGGSDRVRLARISAVGPRRGPLLSGFEFPSLQITWHTLGETSQVVCERSHLITDSSDETAETQPSRRDVHQRVAIVANLLPDSRERAAQIVAEGPPYELGEAGFQQHSVFLAEEAVVFVFEGSVIEGLVRELVDDPARSATFSVWGPLLKGTPVLAREEYHWEADPRH